MIINEYNKDKILSGTVKRGFNQNPLDLKEKIASDIKSKKIAESQKEETTQPKKNEKITDSRKLYDTYNKLSRLK